MFGFFKKEKADAVELEKSESPTPVNPSNKGVEESKAGSSILRDLKRRIDNAGLPEAVYDSVTAEYENLMGIQPGGPEFNISINYLEFVISLPWNVLTRDDLDLEKAESVLNLRHHGLSQVKERILEYLAVKKLHTQNRRSILIVDDEEITRENLSYVFDQDGYEVRTASDGVTAIEAMAAKPANVVVTDLKMQGMDGLNLTGEVRERWPETGIVMLTGYASVSTAVSAMKQGADHYMSKPVNLGKLREHVDELASKGGSYLNLNGPVLCFSGPPGTGKTSIGKAVAEALGRKFIRISLAGLRDEAELRGHRRTYLGALPGRIIQEVQKCGARNPVIMLDEMDKIIKNFDGDATAVLLELLDPQQNSAFVDNYLAVPFDLSEAMFIATVNDISRLSAPLIDRMEEIEFTGYSIEDKILILKDFLLPDQLHRHGLGKKQVNITDDSARYLISSYTREAGLRGLEKETASLCRKFARLFLEEQVSGDEEQLDPEKINSLLGPAKFEKSTAFSGARVGMTTGLVWTREGGEIIFVEAAGMKGSKQLMLTGSLGEVMRESAKTALSYIRSNAADYGIDADFFEHSDIHIHIPAGGVSKEGPSAGVAIAVSLLSLLTGRAVRQDTAVSGELSLLGEILKVGGIRDKLLAASNAGVARVVLPEKCRVEASGLESKITASLELIFVKSMSEVVEATLEN
ncbi:S16 family serine protease [Maridesulfovibrio bastinii]|uniref:S16 family serine protease n=1 Tax=Maridesulfovibrio bastinii TaxID=47157 RepID=UPI000403FF33|nr:S16 family serine protease [Maridesulfovibrio bastinii]